MKVVDKLEKIMQNINEACRRADRSPEEVKIIAVTKYVTAERAKEAVDAGIRHLGENRETGLEVKREVLGESAIWHFIGSLQTRKVKQVIGNVSYIHSLDRHSLAKEIDKRADGNKIHCFVQVNISGEESKHGVEPDKVIDFIREIAQYPNIKVVGLMGMAPLTDDDEKIRSCFRRLKSLQSEAEELNLEHAPCRELSMGMSNDYMIAIEEGATFIRIGTALVGED